jgi:MFS family permease
MRYVMTDRTIRTLIAVNFLIVLVAMPYTMLLPGFVKDVLHEGAFQQGTLQSFQGIGALFGSFFVASAASRGRGKMMIGWGLLLGVGIVAFATSTNYWITLPIMVVIGAGQSGRMAIGQVLIQSYSEEEYRGRVQSVWFMQFSMVQFGTFIVGILAEAFGPQLAIGGMAAFLVVAMVLVATFVPTMRRLE